MIDNHAAGGKYRVTREFHFPTDRKAVSRIVPLAEPEGRIEADRLDAARCTKVDLNPGRAGRIMRHFRHIWPIPGGGIPGHAALLRRERSGVALGGSQGRIAAE